MQWDIPNWYCIEQIGRPACSHKRDIQLLTAMTDWNDCEFVQEYYGRTKRKHRKQPSTAETRKQGTINIGLTRNWHTLSLNGGFMLDFCFCANVRWRRSRAILEGDEGLDCWKIVVCCGHRFVFSALTKPTFEISIWYNYMFRMYSLPALAKISSSSSSQTLSIRRRHFVLFHAPVKVIKTSLCDGFRMAIDDIIISPDYWSFRLYHSWD